MAELCRMDKASENHEQPIYVKVSRFLGQVSDKYAASRDLLYAQLTRLLSEKVCNVQIENTWVTATPNQRAQRLNDADHGNIDEGPGRLLLQLEGMTKLEDEVEKDRCSSLKPGFQVDNKLVSGASIPRRTRTGLSGDAPHSASRQAYAGNASLHHSKNEHHGDAQTGIDSEGGNENGGVNNYYSHVLEGSWTATSASSASKMFCLPSLLQAETKEELLRIQRLWRMPHSSSHSRGSSLEDTCAVVQDGERELAVALSTFSRVFTQRAGARENCDRLRDQVLRVT